MRVALVTVVAIRVVSETFAVLTLCVILSTTVLNALVLQVSWLIHHLTLLVYVSQHLAPTIKTALLDQLAAMTFADLFVSKMTSASRTNDAATVHVSLFVDRTVIVVVANYARLVCAKLAVVPMLIVLRLRPVLTVSALIPANHLRCVVPIPIAEWSIIATNAPVSRDWLETPE